MIKNLLPQKNVSIELNDTQKENLIKIISDIFFELNWTINKQGETEIHGNTSISLTSWGETIIINLTENKLNISSKCVGNQLIDWNKNQKNINSFVNALQSKIGSLKILDETENSYQLEDNVSKPPKKIKSQFLNLIDIFIPKKNYFFTPILALINIIIFIIMAIDGTSIFNPEIEKLIFWGANERSLTLNGELWRIITSVFIHIGIIHLIMNMYALLFIGSLLEPLIGKYKFLLVYILTAIAASTSSLWWNTFSVSAGASGAIFGLFGVFISFLIFNQVDKNIRKPMLMYLSIYLGFNLLNGVKDGIDGAAHIGGLISGFVLGLSLIYGIKNNQSKELNYWIFGIITFFTFSLSYLTLDSIPNPLKKYQNRLDSKINYFELYNLKMKDFSMYESLALEIEHYSPESKEDFLLFIKDRSGYYWNKNLKIVIEIESYSLPEEILIKNQELKKYTKLRIKQLNLLYNKVLHETDDFDQKIIEINQEIEFQISKIINL